MLDVRGGNKYDSKFYTEKQPFDALKDFAKIDRKTPLSESLFSKVAGLSIYRTSPVAASVPCIREIQTDKVEIKKKRR